MNLRDRELDLQDLRIKVPMKPHKRTEYKFGASSCAETATQSPVFAAMKAQKFD
jgi:hypothetical protein